MGTVLQYTKAPGHLLQSLTPNICLLFVVKMFLLFCVNSKHVLGFARGNKSRSKLLRCAGKGSFCSCLQAKLNADLTWTLKYRPPETKRKVTPAQNMKLQTGCFVCFISSRHSYYSQSFFIAMLICIC